MKEIKNKTCVFCGVEFKPSRTTQRVCSTRCSIGYARKKEAKKEERLWAAEKKKRKEALMSHSDWLKLLQAAFNAYIRKRDEKNKENCISCGKKVNGTGHASHFFSVGAYPNLRFNENNVWRSCVECNVHRHGNTAEYAVRLREKLGDEKFNKLLEERNKPLKLSIQEIKEKIKHYKEAIKKL